MFRVLVQMVVEELELAEETDVCWAPEMVVSLRLGMMVFL